MLNHAIHDGYKPITRYGGRMSPLRKTSHSPQSRENIYTNSYAPRDTRVNDYNIKLEIERNIAEEQESIRKDRSRSFINRGVRIQESFSPNKYEHVQVIDKRPVDPIQTAIRVDDLLRDIEHLKRERDHYMDQANLERQKNQELEEEFHILRALIQENSRPIGYEENLVLKTQYHNERELRITAEADVNRLRQQLADALASSHRDTLNLKKALSDMQHTNQQNLQTIYEKGDQNIQQMQQLEDLSKIIRDKDVFIESQNKEIKDLKNENRDLHNTIIQVREEAAAISQIKGTEMLLQSSMKDKMLNDPRYRKIVEKQKADNLQDMQNRL